MPQNFRARPNSMILMLPILAICLWSVTGLAADWEKIPIEQAIEESHRAHEECRLNKIRSFEKAQAGKQVLGALPTQYQYDVNYYGIELLVNIDIEVIWGSIEMLSTATQDGVTFCEIDFYDNMTVDSLRSMEVLPPTVS